MGDFALANVPQLTEGELAEFERLLMIDQPLLRQLTDRPGAQRPVYVGENYTLDRFLNMVRHRIGTQEYR
jgi:succinate dehydrogenase flavin-adding protein (antitoxin of CptAB toxin-antitoxin module)